MNVNKSRQNSTEMSRERRRLIEQEILDCYRNDSAYILIFLVQRLEERGVIARKSWSESSHGFTSKRRKCGGGMLAAGEENFMR